MSTSDSKADADVKREMQHAALKFDISTAKPLKEIVLGEIKLGIRPEWIATKYQHLGVTLERVLAAKAAIEKQSEARRERENAARNGFEAPQGQGSADAT